MPATSARIGFILNEYRRAIATTTATKTRFGSLARETADPIPTFFDSVTDAAAIAAERQALLSSERRRFKVAIRDIEAVTSIDIAGSIPVARYVDTERSENSPMLVSEIILDFGRQSAILTLWG